MCIRDSIKADKNWSSGNTQVVTNDGVSTVYLHGNKIAMVDDTTMTIFDGGWQSNTTKSRLNALCTEFCIAGEGVFQKDFLWYVRKFVGCVNGQNVYKTEDFVSGYLFAWSNAENTQQKTFRKLLRKPSESSSSHCYRSSDLQ